MDKRTRLLMISALDQRRAELRDHWAWIESQPRGTKILERADAIIDDIIGDETRSAPVRLMALLADCAMLDFLLRRNPSKEASDGPGTDTNGQQPPTGR